MKNRIVTYPNLRVGNCVLHEPNCRYLKPTSSRPYTGSRKATAKELRTQPKCKVC